MDGAPAIFYPTTRIFVSRRYVLFVQKDFVDLVDRHGLDYVGEDTNRQLVSASTPAKDLLDTYYRIRMSVQDLS